MNLLINSDARKIPLADGSVNCVVTSPPYYGLRDYQVSNQIGLEPTPDEYVAGIVQVFREVWRVLRDDGTCWLNLGSSYASDGTHPNQFRSSTRVPAYGNDGKVSRYFQDDDCVCHGSCDEPLNENHPHSHHNAHNDLSSLPVSPLPLPKVHDNELPDYAVAFLDAWLRDVQASTNLSLSENDLVSFVQKATALVSLLLPRSFFGDASLYVDMLACISDIAEMSQTSDYHRLGMVLSFLASIGSLFGMDGIIWANFTIPPLKLQAKDLIMIPQLVALALQVDGWWIRSDIVWWKRNCIPESVKDRPTSAHEFMFLLTKSKKYYYDCEAVKTPTKGSEHDKRSRVSRKRFPTDKVNGIRTTGYYPMANLRDVWHIATKPYHRAHYAVFPPDLIEPCILAGCPPKVCAECGAPWERVVERIPMGRILSDRTADKHKQGLRTAIGGDMTSPPMSITHGWQPTCECNADTRPGVVLDPFIGSGTTAMVARKHGRQAIGLDLNYEYLNKNARERLVYGNYVLKDDNTKQFTFNY